MFSKLLAVVDGHVWIMPLIEASISTVFVAKGEASFPLSLLIHRKPVRLSIIVNIAPLWFLPMMVSPSRSPNLSFLSAIAGRWSISTLPAITPLDLYWLPLLAYFRPFRLKCLDSCFPLCFRRLSSYTFVYGLMGNHILSVCRQPPMDLFRTPTFKKEAVNPLFH